MIGRDTQFETRSIFVRTDLFMLFSKVILYSLLFSNTQFCALKNLPPLPHRMLFEPPDPTERAILDLLGYFAFLQPGTA